MPRLYCRSLPVKYSCCEHFPYSVNAAQALAAFAQKLARNLLGSANCGNFAVSNKPSLASYLPPALLETLAHNKGFDRAAFEAVHASGEQVTSVRYNPAKLSLLKGDEPFPSTTQVPWCPDGRYLPQRPSFTLDPLLHAGLYYVQEASSMFLWHMLQYTTNGRTGQRVLDLCAAPGGKTTLLSAYFTNSLLVSNEVIKPRSAVLVENMTKWGTGEAVVTSNDPKDFQPLAGYFDVIVVDAPCSGSGLFRRDPDAVQEWSPENVTLCSQRQQRILADVMPALKQGGVLIYSTCSYSAEEDEQIADWLMQSFELEHIPVPLPAQWQVVPTTSPLKSAEGYRFYPDKIRGEGLYICAFRRKDGSVFSNRKSQLPAAPKKETVLAREWIHPAAAPYFFMQKENLLAIPEIWQADIALLQRHLYLRKAGVNIGAIKGNDLVPSHELALSLLLEPGLQKAALGLDEALLYLRKKEFAPGTGGKGWALATYRDIPLGWMKLLPNRVNNYYPTEWRIIKD